MFKPPTCPENRVQYTRHLPVPRFRAVLKGVGVGLYEQGVGQGRDEGIVQTLADAFNVRWQALLFRLEDLGLIPSRDHFDQGDMGFRG